MKKTYIITLAITSLFIFNGCGGGGSTTGGNTPTTLQYTNLPTVDVSYTLNGKQRPTCHDATHKGELRPTPTDSVICTWMCGRYQGDEVVQVVLLFDKTEKTEKGIWELKDTSVTESNELYCKEI